MITVKPSYGVKLDYNCCGGLEPIYREDIMPRIPRVWYDVCNDYTLDLRTDTPLDLCEMEFSRHISEIDGVIFGACLQEGILYFLGPVGMEGQSIEEYDFEEGDE